MDLVGMDDSFGQSGPASDLIRHYGLDGPSLADRAETLMQRKER
jgi:transketolase C-terminal domain/subunit